MTFSESHDLCDYREGATVAPLIDNVWENCNFKMSYLMAYICYLFKTDLINKTLTPTNNVKFRLLGETIDFFIIMKFVHYM